MVVCTGRLPRPKGRQAGTHPSPPPWLLPINSSPPPPLLPASCSFLVSSFVIPSVTRLHNRLIPFFRLPIPLFSRDFLFPSSLAFLFPFTSFLLLLRLIVARLVTSFRTRTQGLALSCPASASVPPNFTERAFSILHHPSTSCRDQLVANRARADLPLDKTIILFPAMASIEKLFRPTFAATWATTPSVRPLGHYEISLIDSLPRFDSPHVSARRCGRTGISPHAHFHGAR